MTLRRYYENDAWEVLSDWENKIRDYLLKANIKGEERLRIINELMSHVQMKAEEIIERKNIVEYTDVLDIMAELGSPLVIAESYAQDDSIIASSNEELLTEKKVIAGEETPEILHREVNTESMANKNSGSQIIGSSNGSYPVNRSSAVIEMLLLIWRVVQVTWFIQPLFFLSNLFGFTWYYGTNNWRFVVHNMSSDVPQFLQNYLTVIFLFVAVEYYIIRGYIVSNSRLQTNQKGLAIAVYRLGMLSAVPLFSLDITFNGLGLLFTIAGLCLLFSIDLMYESGLKRTLLPLLAIFNHDNITEEQKRAIKPLMNFLVVIISSYTGLVIMLASMIYFKSGNSFNVIIWQIFAIAGGLLVTAAFLIAHGQNKRVSNEKIFRIEIEALIWGLRIYLVQIIMASYFEEGLHVLLSVFLPVIIIENLFTNAVYKATGFDFTLMSDYRRGSNELKMICSSISAAYNQKPVTNSDSSTPAVEQHPENITGHASAAVTSSRQDQLLVHDQKLETKHKSKKRNIPIFAFAWDICILYIKVIIAFSFIPAFYIANDYINCTYGWYGYSCYMDPSLILGYTAFVLLSSSYKLYSTSKRVTADPANYTGLPLFYWLLMIFSWTIAGILFFPLVFGLPFVLIQLSSSWRILKGRRAYKKLNKLDDFSLLSKQDGLLVAKTYPLKK